MKVNKKYKVKLLNSDNQKNLLDCLNDLGYSVNAFRDFDSHSIYISKKYDISYAK